MMLNEGNHSMLQQLNIVRLSPGKVSLLAERPHHDGRSGWATAKETPHSHRFYTVSQRGGDGVRLRLLNSLHKPVYKSMHGFVKCFLG
jgi:hypothetical protein